MKTSKLTPTEENGKIVGYFFDCPGCGLGHIVHVKPNVNNRGASWKFNGNFANPTFTPSILSRVDLTDNTSEVCHLYVTDGKLVFLNDCTHKLAGQSIEMPYHYASIDNKT